MKVTFQACENSNAHGVTKQLGAPRKIVCVDKMKGLDVVGTKTGIVARPALLVTPQNAVRYAHGAMTPTSRNWLDDGHAVVGGGKQVEVPIAGICQHATHGQVNQQQ